MASLRNLEDDELDPQFDNEQLANVLADEPTADAPQDEDEEHRRIGRVKNAKRAQRRRNAQNCAHEPRDLNNAFITVTDREYRTPIGANAEAVVLAKQLPPNPEIQRLQYLTQHAVVQLDWKHPVSSTRNQPSRSKRHGDTVLISRTPGGGPRSWRNDNRQRIKGHPSVRGNNEQEIQQTTRNQRGARHQGQDPLETNLQNAPTIDRFPAFTTSITDKSDPKDFKLVGILKYNDKQDPH
jgi:hypothetical protein